jgi:hypothetical protein
VTCDYGYAGSNTTVCVNGQFTPVQCNQILCTTLPLVGSGGVTAGTCVLPLTVQDTCLLSCDSTHQPTTTGSLVVVCTDAGTTQFPYTAGGCDPKPLAPDVAQQTTGVQVIVVITVTNNTNLTSLIATIIKVSGVPSSVLDVTTEQQPNGTVALIFSTSDTSPNVTQNIIVAVHVVQNNSTNTQNEFRVVDVKIQFQTLLLIIARQPIWVVILLIILIILAVLVFYLVNRCLNPGAKNFIVITFAFSVGQNLALIFFLYWLSGVMKSFPRVRLHFFLSLSSLLLTFMLNFFTNSWLFSRALTEPQFAAHVKAYRTTTVIVFCIATANCALMGLLSSGLFAWWSFSAPMPAYLDNTFAVAGVVTNLFKDLPQLIIQLAVMFELRSVNDGLVAVVFSAISLVFGMGKRAYLAKQSADSEKSMMRMESDIELHTTSSVDDMTRSG